MCRTCYPILPADISISTSIEREVNLLQSENVARNFLVRSAAAMLEKLLNTEKSSSWIRWIWVWEANCMHMKLDHFLSLWCDRFEDYLRWNFFNVDALCSRLFTWKLGKRFQIAAETLLMTRKSSAREEKSGADSTGQREEEWNGEQIAFGLTRRRRSRNTTWNI